MGYELVAGDGGSKLLTTAKDRVTDQALDLTGKSVTLRYRINGGAVQVRAMTPLNQATNQGQAEYTFAPADLIAGDLVGEVVVQLGLSDQLTSQDPFILSIRAPIG